jgi:hypothetical protein
MNALAERVADIAVESFDLFDSIASVLLHRTQIDVNRLYFRHDLSPLFHPVIDAGNIAVRLSPPWRAIDTVYDAMRYKAIVTHCVTFVKDDGNSKL